jgi:hypothetical protein
METLVRFWKKQSLLAKYFYIFIVSFVGIIILLGSLQTHFKPIYQDKFTYTQSQKIYFNNIRSFYYHKFKDEISGFDKYLLRKGSWDTAHIGFHWQILDNIASNEAYLYPYFFGIGARYPETAHLLINNKKYKIYPQNTDSLRWIAYKMLLEIEEKNSNFELQLPSGKNPLFPQKKQIRNTQTLLEDYFKWTE